MHGMYPGAPLEHKYCGNLIEQSSEAEHYTITAVQNTEGKVRCPPCLPSLYMTSGKR